MNEFLLTMTGGADGAECEPCVDQDDALFQAYIHNKSSLQ